MGFLQGCARTYFAMSVVSVTAANLYGVEQHCERDRAVRHSCALIECAGGRRSSRCQEILNDDAQLFLVQNRCFPPPVL